MISIIIPVYNQAAELRKCLDSIERQSYKNYEIIVVDDASKDDITQVAKDYKSKFGISFSFYKNSENKGAPFSRNYGYKKSKGEFIIFCDADVVMREDMLLEMYRVLKENPVVGYAYSSFLWGLKKFKLFEFSADKLKQMPYIHSSSLIRREHFPQNGWDENIKKLQDWDLWLTMLENGHVGIWVDKTLFRVIDTKGTMSGWLPSFFYKALPFLPKVIKYKKALQIVQKKHNL